ncbi:MAG: RNA polymerase sigma-54 factor, partial [Proteobacteria bacterium]|nr:RNA polymerase sigma-54 factor [Pseudomonadota bacterium]
MASGMRQVMRQGQQLVMTQQLQQAIKLLQLSNMELARFVEEQIESNPLLEIESADNTPEIQQTSETTLDPAPDYSDDGSAYGDAQIDDVFTNNDRTLQHTDHLVEGDGSENTPTASSLRIGADSAGGSFSGSFEDDGSARLTDRPTLREDLHQQLVLSVHDVGQQMIGRYLIDSIDDSGYLADDLGDIAERLGCTIFEAEVVLKKLQRFDPPGVFARNLAECLALQLRDRDRLDPAMQTLLDNLDALGDGRLDWLRRRCRVGQEDFAEM